MIILIYLLDFSMYICVYNYLYENTDAIYM